MHQSGNKINSLIPAHLDVARPPVEIEMKVFDFAILGEFVSDILFCGLLVYVSYENYPPFYSYKEQTILL